MLKSPKGFRFSREGSWPSAIPSLDPRILILVKCADITENLLTGVLRIKSNKIKNHNNEPCTVCIRFIAVLFAPLHTARIFKQFTFLVCCQFILKSINIHVSLSGFSLHIRIGGLNKLYIKYP